MKFYSRQMHAGRNNKSCIHMQTQSLPHHRMDKDTEKFQSTTPILWTFKYKLLFSIRPIFSL